MKIIAVFIILASPAHAEDSEAKRHYERGMKAYNLQEFKVALDEFRAAYVERADPAFLFNVAQSQRQLGQFETASRSYRAYLNQAPDASNRPEVERLIVQMDEAARDARARQPPTGTIAPPGSHESGERESASVRRPWYASPTGWSFGAGGALLIGLGVGLFAHGNQLDAAIPGAVSLAQANQLADDRDHYRAGGVAAIVVGGAAFATGTVILTLRAFHRGGAL